MTRAYLRNERKIRHEIKWDADPKQDRFDPRDGRKTMKAVVTAGNGGYDKLQYRVVSLPTLNPARFCFKSSPPGSTTRK